MGIKKFKKEHSTFIAVATTLIVVAELEVAWKYVKKWLGCGNNADEEEKIAKGDTLKD